ncbi:MAG: sulfite exporter TauE/SafE family protein [Asgard group archaeon]|nr:sulfite exporter TauE/SafE family protein [Asgard group archaeon]
MEPIFIFLILIPLALITGIIASLIGIGGGILMVPILNFIVFEFLVEGLNQDITLATTISSTVIIFTGLSGSIAFAIQKRIDYIVGLLSACFSVGGAILGKTLQPVLGNKILTIIFACLLILTAIRMFVKIYASRKDKADYPVPPPTEEMGDLDIEECRINRSNALQKPLTPENEEGYANLSIFHKIMKNIVFFFKWIMWIFTIKTIVNDNLGKRWQYNVRFYLTPLAFVGGFVAGIAGLGGGIVMVPILHLIIGLPIHFSTATSAFIMIFSSISAVSTAAINPEITMTGIWWPYVAGLAIGIIGGTQIGAFVAKKVDSKALRLIFALALVAAGIWTIVRIFI